MHLFTICKNSLYWSVLYSKLPLYLRVCTLIQSDESVCQLGFPTTQIVGQETFQHMYYYVPMYVLLRTYVRTTTYLCTYYYAPMYVLLRAYVRTTTCLCTYYYVPMYVLLHAYVRTTMYLCTYYYVAMYVLLRTYVRTTMYLCTYYYVPMYILLRTYAPMYVGSLNCSRSKIPASYAHGCHTH